MKYNIALLNEYVDKGLLQVQSHPIFPLKIYNYSRECAWEKKWDEITLASRGLILDNEGNIIARPFGKFFNWEEHNSSDIPIEPFEIFEKMDGSLGIIFYYNDEWHIASRGLFTSEQAIKGKLILQRENTKYGLIPGWTYCVEIIYPKNRICVNYGNAEMLVVLGVINNETGKEGNIDNMVNEGWNVVKKYNLNTTLADLKKMVSNNQEGFVIRFKNGMRIKIKGDEYLRLHSLITNFSNKDIWEALKDGKIIDLERVPDEFDTWVKETINELKEKKFTLEDKVLKQLILDFPDNDFRNYKKKEFAEYVKKQEYWMQPVMFSIYNNKSYDKIIWKYVKPKYSIPFWNKNSDEI